MDIYLKPTDSKKFFFFKSYNTKHCLKNTPFSLVRRTGMITEKDFLKEIESKELETLSLEQQYPERIIKASVNKALKIPQNELRIVKEKHKTKNLPFISTFNPNNPKTFLIIKHTLENFKNFGSNEKRMKKGEIYQLQATSAKLRKDIM